MLASETIRFCDLPPDVWSAILSFCGRNDPDQVGRLAKVSRGLFETMSQVWDRDWAVQSTRPELAGRVEWIAREPEATAARLKALTARLLQREWLAAQLLQPAPDHLLEQARALNEENLRRVFACCAPEGGRMEQGRARLAEGWSLSDAREVACPHLSLSRWPDELSFPSQLRSVNLAWNGLQEVPGGLTGLAQLETLTLSHNAITSLPLTMSCAESLRSVCLSFNQIRVLPPWLAACTRLEYLAVSGNWLTSLPEFLANLPRLRQVWVHQNYLPPDLPEPLQTRVEAADLEIMGLWDQREDPPKSLGVTRHR
jgi:hypothetical protein